MCNVLRKNIKLTVVIDMHKALLPCLQFPSSSRTERMSDAAKTAAFCWRLNSTVCWCVRLKKAVGTERMLTKWGSVFRAGKALHKLSEELCTICLFISQAGQRWKWLAIVE